MEKLVELNNDKGSKMLTSTYSMLLPLGEVDETYGNFFLQYSMFTSSNLIIYKLISNNPEERIHDLFINFHGQSDDYAKKNIFLTAMGIEDNSSQKYEERGLFIDKILVAMSKEKRTAKSMLLYLINLKEFVLLYALFEGAMKDYFRRRGVIKRDEYLKEAKVIEMLETSIEDNSASFLRFLKERSPMSNFKEIKSFWDYFTCFRHLYVHSGGYVTRQWLDKYKSKKHKLVGSIKGDTCIVSKEDMYKAIESYNPKEGEMFYVKDEFANLFRNYVVRIMESLHLFSLDYGKKT